MSRLIAIILLLNLIIGTFLFSDSDNLTPQLSVRGEARIRRPADQLTLILGVISEGRTASAALSDNNLSMQKVIDALKTTGLSPQEYQTATFNIVPVLTPRPQNPPPEWRPTIISFKATNKLSIHTEKLSLAGKLIDAAIQAGANTIDSISFGLKDDSAQRTEAISKATTQAIADAETLAEASNVKLGDVLNITLENALIRPKSMLTLQMGGTPVEPGDVEISAAVRIDYKIH